MRLSLRMISLLAAALFVFGSHASAQKTDGIAPPDENASAEETQKWLVGTIEKYGSYKTRVAVVEISNVKFEGCTLRYTITRKSGSTSTAVMGATRTVTAAKDEMSIDTALVSEARVKLSDHVYPELQTIEIGTRSGDATGLNDDRVTELVVKREAGKAIRDALIVIARNCASKN